MLNYAYLSVEFARRRTLNEARVIARDALEAAAAAVEANWGDPPPAGTPAAPDPAPDIAGLAYKTWDEPLPEKPVPDGPPRDAHPKHDDSWNTVFAFSPYSREALDFSASRRPDGRTSVTISVSERVAHWGRAEWHEIELLERAAARDPERWSWRRVRYDEAERPNAAPLVIEAFERVGMAIATVADDARIELEPQYRELLGETLLWTRLSND